MKENKRSLGDLSMYIDDLVRMGFVTEYYKDGKKFFKLTSQGRRSGLGELPQKLHQKVTLVYKEI